MTSRRFFAIIWRINSIVMLAAGAAGLVVLAYAATFIFNDPTRTAPASDVIRIGEVQVDLASASIGDFGLVEGTSVLRASLNLGQQYASTYGSSELSSIQNYLYFSPETRVAYWLIPGYRGLILDTTEYPLREPGEDESKKVVAITYLLVDEDTDNDGKLTTRDSKVLAMSDATGKRFARLLSNVDQVNGSHLKDGALLIFFTSEAMLKVAEVDLATIKSLGISVVKPLMEEIQQVPSDAAAPRG